MHLFYSPEIADRTVVLLEEEAHHAVSVLRLKVGARIGLLDGKGTRAEAEILELDRKKALVNVLERRIFPPERGSKIHLAVALTKQIDRYEWFLEKAVEVGVDRITPLITQRSERTKFRHDRAEKVMIAAMKQSQRTWLPILDQPLQLKELIGTNLADQRFFGWCEGDHASLMSSYTIANDVIVLIGPEGDLTMEEANQLRDHRFQAVSIGSARLRTETAAIAACTWMSLAQQR